MTCLLGSCRGVFVLGGAAGIRPFLDLIVSKFDHWIVLAPTIFYSLSSQNTLQASKSVRQLSTDFSRFNVILLYVFIVHFSHFAIEVLPN